ncbi:MAG: dTDP-4-dehydrorhamnose reductase [Betaproteobacteria bacterium]|nr:MAG: dTDP-4-dehydrorhamnose reductase [Betaproteobacteria bacterium]
MKILVTGAQGQIGHELRRTFAPLGEVIACDRAALDLADPEAIRHVVRATKPKLIVNAGAYTAVDKAESEPALAMAINGLAPGILAEEARRIGGSIIHYSTDYVFDGDKPEPYVEDDTPNPMSVYGRTKLAGEQAVAAAGAPYLIFRTSWIYGNRGRNFLLTIQRLATERGELRVVSDQKGAPTWSRLVAEATALAAARTRGQFHDVSGIYHLTCAGCASWHDFARAIVDNLPPRADGVIPRVHPISTSEYPTPAHRPKNSVLSCTRAKERLGVELPAWEVGMALCIDKG